MSTNNLKTKISDLTKRVNLDGTEVLPLSWEDKSTERYLSYSVASEELTKYATSYAFSYMQIPKKSERTVVEVWEDDYTPVTLQYNKITEVDADVTTVIPVIIGETNGKEKCEYCLKLNVRDTLPTLTFPSDIVWADDLVLELNTHYIILINYENSGLYADWKSYPLSNAEYSKKYLRTTALSSGHIGFNVGEESTTVCSVSYSKDNGETWSTYTNSASDPYMEIYVDVNPGDEILWKGDIQTASEACFSSDVGFNVDGNIMSMRYGDNFIGETELTANAFTGLFRYCNYLVDAKNLILPATTLAHNCYGSMFSGCAALITAPELPATTLAINCYNTMFSGCAALITAPELPITTLVNNCYMGMFSDCTSLTTTPALPATTLANYCYHSMFRGCTSLTTAPELPAEVLAEGCYYNMFQDCTSLTTAPGLPATTLANDCYYAMFRNCTSLKNAPILPATTLVSNCYSMMFYGCSSLNYIRAAFTTTPGTTYTQSWVNGVASTGVFIKNTNALWDLNNEHGVPIGWQTRLDECDKYLCTTALGDGKITFIINANATDVNSISYSTDDGANWTTVMNVNEYQDTPVTVNVQTNDKVLWKGVLRRTSSSRFSSTVDFNVSGNIMSLTYSDGFKNKEQIENDNQFAYLFRDTQVVDAHKLYLPSITSYQCYSYMFRGCSKLTVAPALLPATILAEKCYYCMFQGCTSLATAPELPATTLANGCYEEMFQGCTSLATAPELPATSLASSCYYFMFRGCTSLVNAPALPATTLASNCYDSMFNGCTSLKNVPALPATTLASNCYDSMFRYCTSLVTAPALPATTLAYGCYDRMFHGCTSLTTPPVLPATTLAEACYWGMFGDCTSLKNAPELPVTTLASSCYSSMFSGCTSLTTAPVLPAKLLAGYCYSGMFGDCTSLKNAPVLPAETLISGCYNYMFDGCTSLNYIDASFLTTPSSSYTNNWVRGVASTGTFVKNSKATWDVTGEHGVPTNWVVKKDYSKQYLKTTALTNGTIELLFTYEEGAPYVTASKAAYSLDDGQTWTVYDWTNPEDLLISIPVSTGDEILWKSDISYIKNGYGPFGGTASFDVDGNIMSLSNYDNFINATTISSSNFCSLFASTNVVNAENLVLPITTLANNCYQVMFNGCTSLTTAPALPATTLADYCYKHMFNGCTSLTTAPALPATTLAQECYSCMFQNCTSLTTAPVLPATTLTTRCYSNMFNGCTSLTTAPELPAMTLATECYSSMFGRCTSLTTAPALPATTLADSCYSSMFGRCTSLTTAPALPATTLATRCYAYMFGSCTSLTKSPLLAASTLVNGCYEGMFGSCTSLNEITALFTTTPGPSYTGGWVSGVASTGTFWKGDSATWDVTGIHGVPTGWITDQIVFLAPDITITNNSLSITIQTSTVPTNITIQLSSYNEYGEEGGNWATVIYKAGESSNTTKQLPTPEEGCNWYVDNVTPSTLYGDGWFYEPIPDGGQEPIEPIEEPIEEPKCPDCGQLTPAFPCVHCGYAPEEEPTPEEPAPEEPEPIVEE